MNKENLKKVIQDLEALLTELKSEVYSDPESFIHPWYQQTGTAPQSVPSDDDDGYAD